MPFRHVDAPVVGHRGSDHDEIAREDRRRGDRVIPGADLADALAERHLSVPAEARTDPAVAGIEREESRLDRRGEDALAAGRVGRRRCVGPRGDAARGELGVAAIGDGGVEAPALGAGLRIEREHAPERRGQHQQPTDQDRCRLERHVAGRRRFDVEVAGADAPGFFEEAHVVARRSGRAANSANRPRRRRRRASPR